MKSVFFRGLAAVAIAACMAQATPIVPPLRGTLGAVTFNSGLATREMHVTPHRPPGHDTPEPSMWFLVAVTTAAIAVFKRRPRHV